MNLTAAQMLAAIDDIQRRHPIRTSDPASDGPGERCIASADLDWLADMEEAREMRFREGAA